MAGVAHPPPPLERINLPSIICKCVGKLALNAIAVIVTKECYPLNDTLSINATE